MQKNKNKNISDNWTGVWVAPWAPPSSFHLGCCWHRLASLAALVAAVQKISALMCVFTVPVFCFFLIRQTFLLIIAVAICRVCFSFNQTSIASWQDYSCVRVCVFRWWAGAGGEAALAVQRLLAGAQRVPAAAAQTPQVPLHGHVTRPSPTNAQLGGVADLCGTTGRTWGRLAFPFVSAGWRDKDKTPLGPVSCRSRDAVTPPPLLLPLPSSLSPPGGQLELSAQKNNS